jgi:hypothetical protein
MSEIAESLHCRMTDSKCNSSQPASCRCGSCNAYRHITTLEQRVAELEKACDASARWYKFQKRGGIENATAMAEPFMVDYLRAAGYLLEKK